MLLRPPNRTRLQKAAKKRRPSKKNKDLAAPAGRDGCLLDTGIGASLKCPPLTPGPATRRALIFAAGSRKASLDFPGHWAREVWRSGARVFLWRAFY